MVHKSMAAAVTSLAAMAATLTMASAATASAPEFEAGYSMTQNAEFVAPQPAQDECDEDECEDESEPAAADGGDKPQVPEDEPADGDEEE